MAQKCFFGKQAKAEAIRDRFESESVPRVLLFFCVLIKGQEKIPKTAMQRTRGCPWRSFVQIYLAGVHAAPFARHRERIVFSGKGIGIYRKTALGGCGSGKRLKLFDSWRRRLARLNESMDILN